MIARNICIIVGLSGLSALVLFHFAAEEPFYGAVLEEDFYIQAVGGSAAIAMWVAWIAHGVYCIWKGRINAWFAAFLVWGLVMSCALMFTVKRYATDIVYFHGLNGLETRSK